MINKILHTIFGCSKFEQINREFSGLNYYTTCSVCGRVAVYVKNRDEPINFNWLIKHNNIKIICEQL